MSDLVQKARKLAARAEEATPGPWRTGYMELARLLGELADEVERLQGMVALPGAPTTSRDAITWRPLTILVPEPSGGRCNVGCPLWGCGPRGTSCAAGLALRDREGQKTYPGPHCPWHTLRWKAHE